jgi:hypothetical protein
VFLLLFTTENIPNTSALPDSANRCSIYQAEIFSGFVDNGNSDSLRKTVECQIASNALGILKEILSFSANAS